MANVFSVRGEGKNSTTYTIDISGSVVTISDGVNTWTIDTGAAIPDATGGVTVDAEARAAINALLAVCRANGIIAV